MLLALAIGGVAVSAASAAAGEMARAASSPPDTLELPAARVQAAATASPPRSLERHRLDGEALRRFATLEDALASLPGFRARAQDGLGGYSELRFRGARGDQIEITVDGARLGGDGDAATDLGRWPLLWFTSLEAGAANLNDPVTNGSDPGALARIDLSTRANDGDGEDPRNTSLRARVGSFGAVEAALSLQAATQGGWNWSVGAQGQSARNDYRFVSDNGTFYNPDDDGTWRMENNAWNSRGLRAAARRETGDGGQAFSALWLETRKEYPGLFPAQAQAYGTRAEGLVAWSLDGVSRTERENGSADDGARDAHDTRVWGWSARAQLRRAEDAYRDPGQSLGYLSYEAARASTGVEAEGSLRRALGDRFAARAALRLRGETSGPRVTPYSASRAAPDARRGEAQGALALVACAGRAASGEQLSAEIEARQSLVGFRAEGLAAGDSVERLATARQAPRALRAATEWRHRSGRGEAALGTSFGVTARFEERAPNSGELIGDNLGVKPKLDLRPEETRALAVTGGFDAGARENTASLRATAFGNLFTDPIRLRAHGASPFLRHENGDDYEAVGVEARAAAATRRFEGAVSATLQRARIREGLYAGNAPAYESPLEAYAEAFWKPSAGVRLGPAARYDGPYYPADANVAGTRRDGGWEWDAHAAWTREGGAVTWRAALDARNLGDRKARDFAFSPRSGRHYSLTLSLDL